MRKRNEHPEDTFADAAAPVARLGPMDVQQKEFGVTRLGGGYKMRDVDQFLDELTTSMTALVEENRRLKEQVGSGAMIGAPDLEQVSRQADEIIRRARDDAAQILREAQAVGAAPAPAGDPVTTDAGRAAISAFLLREREFLQSVAGLVQGHAEAVKGMAKEARAASIAAAPPAPEAAATPVAALATTPEPEPEPEPAEPESIEPEPEPREAAAAGPPTQAMEEPVRIDEPQPATVGRTESDDAGDEGDRSLRELFWGED